MNWQWIDTAKYDQLIKWQHSQIIGELFMGLPDSWYEKPTWACAMGHLSYRYLKSEKLGDVCLSCRKSIVLVPPDTTEEKLREILGIEEAK